MNCPKHGEYESKTVEYFGRQLSAICPKCEAELNAAAKADEERRRQEAEHSRLAALGISPRFVNATFDNYMTETEEQRFAVRVCRAYVEKHANVMRKGTSLILFGLPGTGKNHLATAILKGYAALGYHVRMLTLAKMVREVRSTYSGEGDERDAFRRFANYDLLIVNEVGVQSGTDAERNLVFEIFDDRYDNLKPSVIVSNQNMDGLKQFLGERVIDRLRDNGGATIPFTWSSYRNRVDGSK